jgi:hypothetical protein
MSVWEVLLRVVTYPVPNWIVALPILTIMVIKLLWSGDLIVGAASDDEAREGESLGKRLALSGSFHLGAFFANVALSLFGALGVVFMLKPLDTTPLWFALAMVVAAVSSILAWWLLSMSLRKGKRESAGEQ